MRGSVTHHAGSPRTSNTGLAAALTAVGIPLAEKPFLQVMEDGCRERTIWLFEAQSEDGKHDTRQLIAAWDDASWHLAHPEHPFAYIKCALKNREQLIDKVKQNAPLACIRKNGKIGFIPLNASPRTEERFLRQL